MCVGKKTAWKAAPGRLSVSLVKPQWCFRNAASSTVTTTLRIRFAPITAGSWTSPRFMVHPPSAVCAPSASNSGNDTPVTVSWWKCLRGGSMQTGAQAERVRDVCKRRLAPRGVNGRVLPPEWVAQRPERRAALLLVDTAVLVGVHLRTVGFDALTACFWGPHCVWRPTLL